MFYYKVDKDIYLKLFNPNDAVELLNLINSNRFYLREWLDWVDKTKDISDSKDFIHDSRKQFAANNGFQVGIWYKEELVGVIALHEIDWEDRQTEIGYWLGEDYQGKGIITKSCEAIIDYVFEVLELNRVEITCAEKNSKSQAVPERLGFTKEGVIRDNQWLNGRYVNHVIYGLLKEEWE